MPLVEAIEPNDKLEEDFRVAIDKKAQTVKIFAKNPKWKEDLSDSLKLAVDKKGVFPIFSISYVRSLFRAFLLLCLEVRFPPQLEPCDEFFGHPQIGCLWIGDLPLHSLRFN